MFVNQEWLTVVNNLLRLIVTISKLCMAVNQIKYYATDHHQRLESVD